MYVTLAKASERTGLKVRHLRRLAKAGKLPARKAGRLWLVDLDAFQGEQLTLELGS